MAEVYNESAGMDTGVSQPASPDVPQDQGDILPILEKDLKRLKAQKARPTGGVEGITLLNLCFWHDEQYVNYTGKSLSIETPDDKNKLQLTFNMIGPRCNKLMGRLSAFNAPFKARPNRKDPEAMDLAEACDRLIVALDEKCDEPSRLREVFYWLFAGGTAFVYTPWVPNSTIECVPQFQGTELLYTSDLAPANPITGQVEPLPQSTVDQMVASGAPQEAFKPLEEVQITGDVGCDVLGPLNVFIDQNVKSVADLPPGSWVHIAQFKTLEWIKENFQDDSIVAQEDLSLITSRINPAGEATGGRYLKDLIPMVQGSCDDTDPEMALVVQSYQNSSQSRPKGRYVCWVPNQKVLHDADNPYEEIPLVDIHWMPTTTSFWTQAYITPLIAPQRFINKRFSQLGEQANATIYSSLLLGGGLSESDIPADYPGAIKNGLGENGAPNVLRLDPPQMPTWFLNSLELVIKVFNDAAGSADLMEDNSFPGQLRGPNAVPMLQEILDTQWGPFFNHLGERLARVKQQRLNRVKQFYPPLRTLHYTDRTQKDEILTFHTDKVLRSGTNYSVTVERGALLPELRALREARVRERLSGPLAVLYMDERTGKLDKSKIAQDLAYGDTGREDREAQYRKLAAELIKLIWEAKPVPNVLPFYDHKVMLDELEAAMATTEFLRASPQVQQAFQQRWEQHRFFLQQEALAQQQALMAQAAHSAVAQATQQAAAMAAADTVHATQSQLQAQAAQPTSAYNSAAQAHSAAENARAGGLTRPGAARPTPGQTSPQTRVRKLTMEERS